jgi:hypothetical protein
MGSSTPKEATLNVAYLMDALQMEERKPGTLLAK